ncbi:unnamed protein product [Owenia fusiformis]|uniref:Methyltransferase domain-containing protein n=1 Tax=Owenia fusiformis TaxID=6347 RepID=A0A8S4PR53_OWEFU|nr:unnamed protein product [Owenia fusiformis]
MESHQAPWSPIKSHRAPLVYVGLHTTRHMIENPTMPHGKNEHVHSRWDSMGLRGTLPHLAPSSPIESHVGLHGTSWDLVGLDGARWGKIRRSPMESHGLHGAKSQKKSNVHDDVKKESAQIIEFGQNILPSTPNATAEELFYSYGSGVNVICDETKEMGVYPGGWLTCQTGQYKFKKPCLVYSVGINNDWKFDDAVSNQGCFVHAYDPSMKKESHMRSPSISFHNKGLSGKNEKNWLGWEMKTMSTLLKENGDDKKIIDILKIDCEYCEWEALSTMLDDGVLNNVKQLVFEWHITSGILRSKDEIKYIHKGRTLSDTTEFAYMYNILRRLYDAGFRMFYSHQNPTGNYKSIFTGKSRSCCFEVYYININFKN